MKLKVNPENIIVIIIVIYIIFWASNLTNNYPLKLVEICNEKLIILLVLGLLYYLVYLKKYTLAILTLIVVSFFYLNIPMLSENFIENFDNEDSILGSISEELSDEQKELMNNIENIDTEKLVDLYTDTTEFKEIETKIKNVDHLTKKIKNRINNEAEKNNP
jgi:hypothetical protein